MVFLHDKCQIVGAEISHQSTVCQYSSVLSGGIEYQSTLDRVRWCSNLTEIICFLFLRLIFYEEFKQC